MKTLSTCPTFEGTDETVIDREPSSDPLFKDLLQKLAVAPPKPPKEALRRLAERAQLEALSGTTLGQFHIHERLGIGGMGIVYRAFDMQLCRWVALKLLLPRDDSKNDDTQILVEARSAAAVLHPNLATVYAAGVLSNLQFIAMEYVPGEPLRQRLKRSPLPLVEAIKIVVNVAEALDAAHAHGIIHRDVKPDNIMLTPEGVIKLLDFGIAERLAADGSLLPSGASPAGTAGYMAPEQKDGAPADPRNDIYSTGVLLQELIAFSSSPRHTKPSKNLVKKARCFLKIIIQRCMHPEPQQRYASAADLAHNLRRVLQVLEPMNSEQTIKTETPSTYAKQKGRSLRLMASGLGTLLFILTVVGFGSTIRTPTKLPYRSSTLQTSPSNNKIRFERLTAFPAEQSPLTGAIAPDGAEVAYIDDRGVVLHCVFTDTERVLRTPSKAQLLNISWTGPDGPMVATTNPGGRRHLLKYTRNGTRWQVAVRGDYLRGHESPNGRWIAAINSQGLWLIEQQSRTSRVPLVFGRIETVAWSPDNQKLAYIEFQHDGTASLSVVGIDGSPPRKLLDDPRLYLRTSVAGLVWLDESEILIGLWENRHRNSNASLWKISATSENPSEQMTLLTTLPNLVAYDFSYSPHTKTVAVIGMQTEADVFVRPLNGKQTSYPIATSDWNEYPSTWVKDRVLFTSRSRGQANVAFSNASGTDKARPFLKNASWPRITADGTTLFWRSIEGQKMQLMRQSGSQIDTLSTFEVPDVLSGSDQPLPNTLSIHCPVANSKSPCVMSEQNDKHTIFWNLNTTSGDRTFRAQHPKQCSHGTCWDVSPSGKSLAIAGQGEVQIISRKDTRRIPIPDCPIVQGVAYRPDHRGLFVTAALCDVRPSYRLMSVSFDGKIDILEGKERAWLGFPVAAPDGSKIAFTHQEFDNDLWLLHLQ